jgi:putative DNA primase/helicase
MKGITKEVKKPNPFLNLDPYAYALEMRVSDQWLYSRLVEKADGNWSKPPCDANGYFIDGTDPNNLKSFEIAFPTCKANLGKLSGLAFSIQASSPIKAMDFDHVYDKETRKWNQQALEELKSLKTRVEWSPSDTGVHVYFTCTLMLENENQTQPDGTKREIYFGKHITTVTGKVVEGFPTAINEVDPELVIQFYNKWFSDKKEVHAKKEATDKTGTKTAGKDNFLPFDTLKPFVNKPDRVLKDLFPTKDQVMVLCRNAPNGLGEKFDRLFKGNITGYTSEKGKPDESRADLAIASLIVFHTSDYWIIKEIIQESALWDEKWERNNYCQRTIMKAIQNRRR